MRCEKFKCVYLEDGDICEPTMEECTGEQCENYGECINCQEQSVRECAGLNG